MSSFDSRKDEVFNQYIAEQTEIKIAAMTKNFDMPDSKTNAHRGYIAALRDVSNFYNHDLPRHINKE
jgi:hypothetical protein